MNEISSTSRRPATPTVQVDNERVKVTEWRFAPGAETGWHRHAYDYVVVPLTTGKLQLNDGKQDTFADLTDAYDVLRDPSRRRAYDRTRDARGQAPRRASGKRS